MTDDEIERELNQPPPRDWLAKTLRVTAVAALLLSAIAAIAAFLPGVDIYRDVDDCAGGVRALCTRTEVLVRTEIAGGWSIVGMVVPIAIGALVLYRHPRPLVAVLWPVILFAIAIAWLVATFELEFDVDRSVPRYGSTIVSTALGTLTAILLVLAVCVPIVVGARAFIRWRRHDQAERDRIPRARVL